MFMMLIDDDGHAERVEWISDQIEQILETGELRSMLGYRDSYARLSARSLLDGDLKMAVRYAAYFNAMDKAASEWVERINEHKSVPV